MLLKEFHSKEWMVDTGPDFAPNSIKIRMYLLAMKKRNRILFRRQNTENTEKDLFWEGLETL